MIIRCWGSRGSIPVSGPQFIKYGGDTTCLEIRSKSGAVIVVDAGSGIRALGNRLLKEKSRKLNMIFTHAHWDHLLGFGFFKPLYTRGFSIRIYGYQQKLKSYKNVLGRLLFPPFFPVSLNQSAASLSYKTIEKRTFAIGTISVTAIPLNHPNGGFGFRFEEHGASFIFLTDNELDYPHPGGLSFDEYVGFCKGADLLIHDAEFTKNDYRHNRSWGHSLYTDAVRLAIAADVKRLGLFHINQERTDDQVDAIVKDSKKLIAKSKKKIACCAVSNTFVAKV